MGKRGPKPQPKHVAKLKGSWRAKKRAEPTPAVDTPECPDWLDDEARAEWGRLEMRLTPRGLWSKDYQAILTMYCEAWGEFVTCVIELSTLEERTTTSEKGNVLQHPLVAVRNKAVERINRLGQQLGFSPTAQVSMPQPAVSGPPKIPRRPRK